MKTTSENKLFIINWETLDRLPFQFVPLEVNENRESFISEQKVVGRNHPELQYLGGKTTLNFSLNLYGDNVVSRANFFKQFSMKDGINTPPPLMKIVWGGLIPDNSLWVVKSSKPIFSLFLPNDNFRPRMCVVSLDLIKWTPDNYTFNDVKL